jgi:N-acetylglucosaminyl-diphospho-decaprenol L-rhamnosyltransferase
MQLDVSVLLVSYKTPGLLGRCLAALRASLAGLSHETIIVDNASNDGSVALIKRQFADCRLIENDCNIGFGRANNQALPWARGRYVLLLNTDAFVMPDTLGMTVQYMDAHPRCGIVGVNLIGSDGAWQPSARYFPTPLNIFLQRTGLDRIFRNVRMMDDPSWDRRSIRACDWVPGCYYLIRREVIDQVGLFDPRYFLYYEEVDHCYAAKKAGWDVACVPQTSVVHLGGASAKSDGEVTSSGSQIESMQIESEMLYFRKNHGLGAVLANTFLISAADAIVAAKRLVRGKTPFGFGAACRRLVLLWSLFLRTRQATRPTR